jgi:hypothetical protein
MQSKIQEHKEYSVVEISKEERGFLNNTLMYHDVTSPISMYLVCRYNTID